MKTVLFLIKNFDERTERWIGLVCEVAIDDQGEPFGDVTVCDTEAAETPGDLERWADIVMKTQPWKEKPS